jgi:pimeloyl-ACP methyl ester carboxylesterase
MSTFILVHGAWHGAWCWHKVTPLLELNGHTVLAPDLPGANDLSVTGITLEHYVDHIVGILQGLNDKVILVGHSMAGLIIARVAELIPEKVKALVYLCAFMPISGESLMDIVNNRANPHMVLEFTDNFTACQVKDEHIVNAFYHRCELEDIEYGVARLQAHPTITFQTKVELSETNYGSVPRYYIECTDDKAVSIEAQREMLSKQTVAQVYTLDTDHSPFFSAPNILGDILNDIAIRYN